MSRSNILFSQQFRSGSEQVYIDDVISSGNLSGDGKYTGLCKNWLEDYYDKSHCLLTPSGTAALELAALLLNLSPGDEVILPSFTFTSTANAFALFGAKLVFVDIDPCTMNIDPFAIQAAVTKRTKAIVVVHYAGYACEMNSIMKVADEFGLFVIEDAAQAFQSRYYGSKLGNIGHLGILSFHATKNITSGGEGGALIINDDRFSERAEIIREKGTNRTQFLNGMVDKYTWCDLGSSYLPSELQAAYLLAQLDASNLVLETRRHLWQKYNSLFLQAKLEKNIRLPLYDDGILNNGHIYFIKVENLSVRSKLISYLRQLNIQATFHYIPLHSTPIGQKVGYFAGVDKYTTRESECIIRLPMHCGLSDSDIEYVVDKIKEFFIAKS